MLVEKDFADALINDKTIKQKKELNNPGNTKLQDIVITDECGDSLWDAVIEQEYPALKYPTALY